MALCGRDMVGIAKTGSGKTLSFALPALIHAKAQQPLRDGDGPIVLILAPTRELCTQICEEIDLFARKVGLFAHAVYGGASSGPQKDALSRGVPVLVATPGRLIDLHEQGCVPLGRVTFLVLDEADRMLDMGFKPQLEKIIPRTNPKRQTLMWSATWPAAVKSLARDYTSDAIQVNIGSELLTANSLINQKVIVIEPQYKDKELVEVLKNEKGKVIVFCNMKRTCDDIERLLCRDFRCATIHGDKMQSARERIINDFKSGNKNILIATDVAARGLDVKDVKLVINYDFPNSCDDYVHRVGRTARGADKEGFAVTFFSSKDSGNARELVSIIREAKQNVPQELINLSSSGYGSRKGFSSYGRRRY
jgi:ATP-dependent RNA helicase DDX5/DBP2